MADLDFFEMLKELFGGLDQETRQEVLPSFYDKSVQPIAPSMTPAEPLKAIAEIVALPHDAMTGEVDPLSEQGVERAADLAGILSGGATVPTKYPVGSLGVFGSRLNPESKLFKRITEDFSKINYDLDNPAISASQKLKDVGLSKDINGNWIAEVDDSGAKLANLSKVKPEVEIPLTDVLHHPDLYETFPYLKDVKVKGITEKDSTGYYIHKDGGTIGVDVSQSPEEIKKTLLHEIQHAVNANERDAGVNRAMGESVDEGIWDRVSKAYDIYEHMRDTGKLSPQEDSSLQAMFRKLQTKFQTYRRNPGEVEARNVEDRMHLSAQARREILPSKTETVPRSEQLDLHEIEEIHNKLFPGG